MDWDKLRIFHAVADAGSFTHAGDTLHLSQSAVSRQVSGLEADLGVSLFQRHARGLIMTEQGELLYRTVHDVLMQLETARARLSDSKDKPKGELRITTTVGLGSSWLASRLSDFADLYPDVNVQLLLRNVDLDLAKREADCAIRLHAPSQPDFIQRKIFTVHFHIYAAPDYLKKFGVPKSIDDLAEHRLITFGEPIPGYLKDVNWLEKAGMPGGKRREVAIRADNILAIKKILQSGGGVAILPDYMVEPDSGLERVLVDEEMPSLDAYFVYPSELKNVARIRAFRDFLLSNARRWDF
jgi:DNA-binding transcriptional LysR family regulator